MPIPEHYQQYCNNPELEIYSCDFMIHKDCPATCSLCLRLSQGITHTAKTGLQRHLEKKERARQKGFYWDEMRISMPNNIPNEIEGEYRE